jgi:hypothetical protein
MYNDLPAIGLLGWLHVNERRSESIATMANDPGRKRNITGTFEMWLVKGEWV